MRHIPLDAPPDISDVQVISWSARASGRFSIAMRSRAITERNALPNQYVQPETRLYTITDLSTVWVNASVFQDEVGRVKPGDPAAVRLGSLPPYPAAGATAAVDGISCTTSHRH